MSVKITRLLDRSTGLMECRACGARHYANVRPGGSFERGSWKCQKGCTWEDVIRVENEILEENEGIKKLNQTLDLLEKKNADEDFNIKRMIRSLRELRGSMRRNIKIKLRLFGKSGLK